MQPIGEGVHGLIVIKIGTSTLVDEHGMLDRPFIETLCSQMCEIVAKGDRVIFVSSGAVAAGMERLGLHVRPTDTPTLQACAAAGQASLIETYSEVFSEHGVMSGQVLLTRGDTADRTSYLNARNTLDRLLDLGCIPIVNENDTVSVGEFAFGDNDILGAIVASLVGADLYVILSDVDGLYSANPLKDPGARLISRVDHVDSRIASVAGDAGSSFGTGGMSSKVRAGRAMLVAGIPMVICRGRQKDVILDVAAGKPIGTRFESPAGAGAEGSRKLWIGIAGISKGSVVIDDGACRALVRDGASLLPVGVVGLTGTFERGEVVNVMSGDGSLVGRGVVRYSSQELEKIRGLKLDVVERFYPDRSEQPCIHRDELLIF